MEPTKQIYPSAEQNDTNNSENEWESKTDVESTESKRIPYPKRIFCIIGNEFCERFNFYGMRSILVIYLTDKLGYTGDDATSLYHGFGMIVHFTCIFGGIISDVYLGKFKTILSLSMIYAIGSSIVSISSVGTLNISPKIFLMIGLIFIAFGSGGIKPCVAAFGVDQFKLPQQAAQAATYFSMFYFALNSAALLSTTLTPIFRKDVHCFGSDDCYPLAFGVPAVLMIIAIVLFLIGKSSYTHTKMSSENILVLVTKCVTNAFSTRSRERRTNPRKNLLDYSINKYGEELVNDVRSLLRILVLYLPVPLFFALFEQQGSRWTLQAKLMNGDQGFIVIKPDHMQLASALFVLMFITLLNNLIYPILNKLGIRRPLQKMFIGGMMAAVSFLFSALIQFYIESLDKIEGTNIYPVNILWQIPQYLVMTLGEVMFFVTGLEFSYEQAPVTMKSIFQSVWVLTDAIGHAIVLVVTKIHIFPRQSYEFTLFSILMVIDMLIFAGLAYRFKSSVKPKVENKPQRVVEPVNNDAQLNTSEEKRAF